MSGCRVQNAEKALILPESSEIELPYHVEYEELPSDFLLSTVQLAYHDSIYLAGKNYEGNLIHGILEGNTFTPFLSPPSIGLITAACVSEDKIIALHTGSEENSKLQIQDYDENGSSSFVITVQGIQLDDTLPDFLSVTYDADYFYLLTRDQLLQVNHDGVITNHIDLSEESVLPARFVSLCKTESGIAVCLYGYDSNSSILQTGNGAEIHLLDLSSFSLNHFFSDENSWPLGISEGGDDTIYYIEETGMKRISMETENVESILIWKEIGLPVAAFDAAYFTASKEYLLCQKNATELCVITNKPITDERAELVLLCNQASPSLTYLIQRYNLTNKDYYITLQYNEANEELSEVKTIVGDAPDLYYFSQNVPLNSSLQENMFEDIYAFMDNDAEYSRDSVIPSLRIALENHDHLYILPFDFMIWTFITTVEVNDYENLSFDQFIRQLETQYPNQQILPSNITRDEIWYWVRNLCVGSLISEETATCNFDSKEYVELLESISRLPATAQSSDDDCLLKVDQIGNILRIYGFDKGYHDSYSFIGCPLGALSNGSAFYLQQCFAISRNSLHKEGAWQFLRSVLAPSVINNTTVSGSLCLPASALQLSALIGQACGSGYNAFGQNIQISDHGAQELYKIINEGNSIMNAYPEIISVMQEEANRYFSGQHSAEDAAAATQSRVSLIMSEQYGY